MTPIEQKTTKTLTATFVENITKLDNGKIGDKYYDGLGMGLFLLVRQDGGKQWKQRLTVGGKRRDLGLGSFPKVTLNMARERALKNQREAWHGIDRAGEREERQSMMPVKPKPRKTKPKTAPRKNRKAQHLTALFVEHVKKEDNGKTVDKYFDNNNTGLHLLVRQNNGKQWKQRIVVNGVRRELGLGGYPVVTLQEARKQALENKREANKSHDIVLERRRARKPQMTFEDMAWDRHTELLPTWRNPKHGDQWINTLKKYAFPRIGQMDIAEIKPLDVKEVLLQRVKGAYPFWHEMPETAKRVKQRMEDIFKCAVAGDLRPDNPVAAIAVALPKQTKKKMPHRALPYEEVAGAIAGIRRSYAMPATLLSFEWLVLTATRSSETRLACWKEIDFEAKIWTIPAERMKANREHRVPLSSRCLEILDEVKEAVETGGIRRVREDEADLIFPGRMYKRPLSEMTYTKILRDLRINAVPHGFRTSFRMWVQERTNAPGAVAEAALAHTNPNKVEAAYARSDYLEKRRELMQLWADYLAGLGQKQEPSIRMLGG